MKYLAIYTRQLENGSVNPKSVNLFLNDPDTVDNYLALEYVCNKFRDKARTQGRTYLVKPIKDDAELTTWYTAIGYPMEDILSVTGTFKIDGTIFTELNPLSIIMTETKELESVWEDFTNVTVLGFA